MTFESLRNKYDSIIYHDFKLIENEDCYKIIYDFEIPTLSHFKPSLEINKKDIVNDINSSLSLNIIFNIGMIELISYYKVVCPKKVIIEAGFLDDNQKNWFKKLYFYGLGEFMYVNNIQIEEEDLLEFIIKKEKIEEDIPINYQGSGNLIPVGGGKDSNVTLEILNGQDNTCFAINPKEIHEKCINVAGYDNCFKVKRILDRNLLELNKKGYLNGHTPFSSLVAFISYLCAYLANKKYIVLSNEASANEATVIGTKINHQYSKTYEFENDFNEYTKKYFKIDVKYFSLLRPLTEYQIAMLFANYSKYHSIFKSCNVGSKSVPWVWCNDCPKCLFVFSILSPFLYKNNLINIFGENLFEKKELLKTFKELLGYSETKPFECVGTYSEVRYAISKTIKKIKGNLPYLLKYYQDNYPLELDYNYEQQYNDENNLDDIFEELLKKELNRLCVKK